MTKNDKPAIGEARVVERPLPGRTRFVPIGHNEVGQKTPRVPAKRPTGSKRSE